MVIHNVLVLVVNENSNYLEVSLVYNGIVFINLATTTTSMHIGEIYDIKTLVKQNYAMLTVNHFNYAQ